LKTCVAIAVAAVALMSAAPALAVEGSFRGSCFVQGKVTARTSNTLTSVTSGPCTGSVNGGPVATHPATFTTFEKGSLLGPLPLLASGQGSMTFDDSGVVIGYRVRQTTVLYELIGNISGSALGTIQPARPHGFKTHLQFYSAFTG